MSEELEELYRKAILLFQNKQWDEAIAAWTEIIRLVNNPKQKSVIYSNRGNAYSDKGDKDRAIQDYDKAIELNPQNADAFNNRGVVYRNKGDKDRAIQDYDKAIELNPQHAEVFYNRGVTYSDKGDKDRAIQDYDKAIELNPQHAEAFNNRGVAYSDKGDKDRAIQDYAKAIELNPQNAKAFNNCGNAYRGKGDPDRAIQDYDKAIELNQQDVGAFNNRGLAYSDKGDKDRAIQDYDKAIELNPQHAIALNNRGNAYRDKGDPDRAIQDYDKAIELKPQHAIAFNNRGNAYSDKGDKDRAIQDYDKATELDPQYADAFYNRGSVYRENKDPDRAIQDYDKAIELNPQHALAFNNCGLAYLVKGKFALAFESFVNADNCDKSLKSWSPLVYIAFQLANTSLDEPAIVFEPYTKLFFAIDKIQSELFCKPPEDGVAHYTSLHVLKSLADNDPFRLYNVAYMHDPDEGRVFFEIMKDKRMKNKIDVRKIFYKNALENTDSSPAYIGSFVKMGLSKKKEKDNLFLWRTYGKHDNEEAAGACLIFNKGQFAKRNVPSRNIGTMSQQQEDVTKQGGSTKPNLSPALYKVIYKSETEIQGNNLSDGLNELALPLKAIDKFIKSHRTHKEKLAQLVRELLDSIRFLFKADHYREEHEVRVVQMSYDTDGKKLLGCKVAKEQLPPRFYRDMPKNFRFSEVILGPKTANEFEWQHWLGDSITVRKSKITFR